MRTNIVLDDQLVKEGLRLTNAKTKKDLVNMALKELVEKRQRKRLLEYAGRVRWEGDLDKQRRARGDLS